VYGARDVQVSEHAVAATAYNSTQWHAVAMRLSASISPPLHLFTVGETNFLLGLKPAVWAVPAVAMYLRLQTIVNVSPKFHSKKHIHLMLGLLCRS